MFLDFLLGNETCVRACDAQTRIENAYETPCPDMVSDTVHRNHAHQLSGREGHRRP